MSRHTGPMTDNYIQALRRRTELRLGHSRLQLGERWLLHPANAVRPFFDPAAGLRAFAEACKSITFSNPDRFRSRSLSGLFGGFQLQAVPREWRL